MEVNVVKTWMKRRCRRERESTYHREQNGGMLGMFLGWFCWLCLHDFLMVFPLAFWWSTSLRSEDFTHVKFACNEGDYKGFCMPLSHGYMAGSVAKMAAVFWFLSPWLLLILEM